MNRRDWELVQRASIVLFLVGCGLMMDGLVPPSEWVPVSRWQNGSDQCMVR
jgi:hypothetical protein